MPGRRTPPDKNYKLYGQYGGKAKYEAAKKARDDAKIKAKGLAGNTADYYYTANKLLNEDLSGPNGWYDLLNQAKQSNDTVNIAKYNAEIAKVKAKISTIKA
jgi:hypothetical protein